MVKVYLSALFLILTSANSFAQSEKISCYGNFRFAHIGSDTKADGLGGPNTLLRLRPGVKYHFNESHSFSGRLAYLVSTDFEPFEFTIKSNGNRELAYGSLTFDEFYYQFQDENFLLKVGRFQKSVNVLTNAKRSHLRFQSNANFVHWSDGLYLKKDLNEQWFGEAIIEYQNRDAVSYPYKSNLTFGDNEHNLNYYLGVENQNRDKNNIIQKGFGILIAPKSYLKPDGYSAYFAVSSRIAIDIPKEDLLKGGSFRIAGELGQNLNTNFESGTSAVASIGINNFANKHELMIEFAKTDAQWLTVTSYGVNSDEMELRYRYFISEKLNTEIRYRIRVPRSDFVDTQYSTFLRLTYSL